MSLEKIYSSRPFKAMAALLFGVMVLSACQETAQVVNKPAIDKSVLKNESIAQSEATQAQAIAENTNTPLSEQERALAKKLGRDDDFIALREMQQTLLFKMKIAIGHDKERFKQAMMKNDAKTVAALMNFSESEYLDLSNKVRQSMSNLKTRFKSDMGTLDKFSKKNPVLECKTCQTDPANITSGMIDMQFEKITKAQMTVMGDKVNTVDENCPQDKRDRQDLGILRCFITSTACIIGASLSIFAAWLAPLCLAAYVVCCLDVQCAFCGCPW